MCNINTDIILKRIDNAKDCAITVFGDFCLDKYLYIDSVRDEVSVETGLPAYQVERIAMFPGVGGTITQNLRSLGAMVQCVGLIGNDGEGFDFINSLSRIGADTEFMVQSDDVMTCTYMKTMRKTEGESFKEMPRFDIRNFRETPAVLEEKLIINLEKTLKDTQAVVIADQFLQNNYAAVTDRIRKKLSELALKYDDKIFYVDSRGFADHYQNMIVKCNQFEFPNNGDDGCSIEKGGMSLLASSGRAAIITAAEDGAYVFKDDNITHIPAFPVTPPIDITGAGDAANAGIILGLALGLDLIEAVLLGICCSSITIEQVGVTGVATPEQVKQRLISTMKNERNDL